MRKPVRFVTGHDETGKSVFLSEDEPPQFHERGGRGVDYYEMWNTEGSPAPITSVPDREPNDRPLLLIPPKGGTIVRILDIHPGHVEKLTPRPDGRHPGMHRTRTIDYGIVIEGEIWMILDDAERLMRPGDVGIHRGTDHAWHNRSDKVCRIAFVLIDGAFSEELKAKLPNMEVRETSFTQAPAEDH